MHLRTSPLQIRNTAPTRPDSRHAFQRCACHHPLIPWAHRRLATDLAQRQASGGTSATMQAFQGFKTDSVARLPPIAPDRPVVLTNLRLFDGQQATLRDGLALRIEGNRIQSIDAVGLAQGDVLIIDCGGRTVMPGLIDAHWHATLCGITQLDAMTADVAYIHLVAAHEAERTLMRGFTTVRDAGGPSFALKRAIDHGLVNGPRIYPCGAMISQTSGHGDFRMRHEVPATSDTLSHPVRAGMASIADGVPEVLRRVREQLMLGASQIKMTAGGGVTSAYDPLDGLQFTDEEMRAGVAAASDWGTYVMVHVYTPAGIQRAIRAGVRSIEHGQLADEETVRMMADHGTWWSLQPFLADEDANLHADPASHAKQLRVSEGTERAYEMAQRFQINTAWGTDILFTPQNLPRHGRMLSKLTRFQPPLDVLRMATGRNGELLRLSGTRNPYDGDLGVLAPGALADLLVVDGDPSRDLDFLQTPDQSLRLIMKDGKVYKNALP